MDCFLCLFEILKALTNSSQRIYSYVVRILLTLFVICCHFQQLQSILSHLKKALLHRCPLTVLKCPLSILERCPSYGESSYSKMTEKRLGPTQDVRLKEVSV